MGQNFDLKRSSVLEIVKEHWLLVANMCQARTLCSYATVVLQVVKGYIGREDELTATTCHMEGWLVYEMQLVRALDDEVVLFGDGFIAIADKLGSSQ